MQTKSEWRAPPAAARVHHAPENAGEVGLGLKKIDAQELFGFGVGGSRSQRRRGHSGQPCCASAKNSCSAKRRSAAPYHLVLPPTLKCSSGSSRCPCASTHGSRLMNSRPCTTRWTSKVLPSVGRYSPFSNSSTRQPPCTKRQAAAAPPAPEPTMMASGRAGSWRIVRASFAVPGRGGRHCCPQWMQGMSEEWMKLGRTLCAGRAGGRAARPAPCRRPGRSCRSTGAATSAPGRQRRSCVQGSCSCPTAATRTQCRPLPGTRRRCRQGAARSARCMSRITKINAPEISSSAMKAAVMPGGPGNVAAKPRAVH